MRSCEELGSVGFGEAFARNLMEFLDPFGTDETCLSYLSAVRWPDGFMCPVCGSRDGWATARGTMYCRGRHRQTSPTATAQGLQGHRHAKDQLLRASQAIPLNIAEGNGKATGGDRRRTFEIARGSALESGAVQDVLQVCGALSAEENESRKALLDRIVAMLTKLRQRGYAIHEEPAEYAGGSIPIPTPNEIQATRNHQPSIPGDA